MKITAFSNDHNVILGTGITLGSTQDQQAPSMVATLTNQTGGNCLAGDVVVVDTTNDDSFKTTSSPFVTAPFVGVLADDIDSGDAGFVYVGGYVPYVNVNGSNTTRGYFLGTALAKTAQAVSARQAGTFGPILTGGTTPNAVIWAPDLGAGTGGSLEVAELDGSPDVTGVTKIQVSNGSLTNVGGGVVSIVTGGLQDQGTFTYLDATDAAAPANPSSGHARIYSKSGRIYSRDSSGNEYGPFDAAGAGGIGDFGSVATITPVSLCAFGGIGAVAIIGGPGSGGWPAANRALLIPFVLPEARTVYKVGWINGTSPSGNADVGVYSASGTRLVSAGSTACVGASSVQVVDVTDTALSANTLYYMAMACDGTQTVWRYGPSAQICEGLGVRHKATSFPLPDPLTGTTFGTNAIPMFFLETVAL